MRLVRQMQRDSPMEVASREVDDYIRRAAKTLRLSAVERVPLALLARAVFLNCKELQLRIDESKEQAIWVEDAQHALSRIAGSVGLDDVDEDTIDDPVALSDRIIAAIGGTIT